MTTTRPASTFVDFDRWGVYNAPTQEGHKGARITFGFRIDDKGRKIPRVSVNTGNPEDEFKGFVSQGFQLEVMYSILHILEKVAQGGPTKPFTFENYGGIETGEESGTFSREKILKTKLAIGKDDNGIVWMGLIADGRTKRKIDILFNEYHKILHPDQTPFTAAEGSVLQALSMVRGLRAAYDSMAATPRPAFTPNGQGGQFSKPRQPASAPAEFEGLDL